MTWKNYDAVLNQLRAAGLDVDEARLEVDTAKPIRCCEFDGDRENRGWYWLSEILLDEQTVDGSISKAPYLIGSYGIFRGNDSGKQKIRLGRNAPAMSAEQAEAARARHAENVRRARALQRDEHERASRVATNAWAKYTTQTVTPSDYLVRKCVKAHGLRFAPSGNGTTAVPMCDRTGKIWGLQIIRGKDRGNKREKEYWPKGLSKKGKYHLIGTPRDVVLIAEGYATAATLHEATGLPVVVAFDAGNMLPVAVEIHQTYRRCHILMCADDDYLSDGNPGVSAAQSAALAVDGAWVKPVFPSDRGGKKLTDFNDLATFAGGGVQMVRAQIEAALSGKGWLDSASPVRANSPQGGGGGSDGQRRGAVSTLPLEQLVERFIHVDDVTGDFVFDTWTSEVCKFSKMVKMLPARVRTDDIKDHPLWKSRAVYIDQIGFDPGGEDPNVVCNRWAGWPTTPKAGCCERLLDLLRYLCGGESNADELYGWVLKWLAYPLQHPGAKMHSAIVVHGPQGTGKSRFFEAYAKIFGDYSIVLTQSGIEDKFNADWAERKLFVLADEIVANAEKYHMKNQLKNFITGEWVRINPKNVAAHKERNHMNIVFLSNEKQPVVLENDDRRHCVIWTPGALTSRFYDEIGEEIALGGVPALHHYLLNIDLGDFKPWTRPPMTAAKRALQHLGAGSEERFVGDWIEGLIDALPFCPAGTADVYAEYLLWCRREGESRPRPSSHFWAYVAKLDDWFVGVRDRHIDLNTPKAKSWRCVIPSSSDLERSAKNGRGKDYRLPPGKSRTDWLTECYFEVVNARNSRTAE